jgi:hypothetical protein
MAVARSLRRLLRIRDLEEEQCRLALESALAERSRLLAALATAAERDRRGRRLAASSAPAVELADRFAGLEETRIAKRVVTVLTPRLTQMEQLIAARRQEYLSKRVERRQAETLISETEQRDAIDAGRRSQQALDDWYGNRVFSSSAAAKSSHSTADLPTPAAPFNFDPSDAEDNT